MSERTFDKTLHVRGRIEIVGYGDDINLKLNAFRRKKTGSYENYDLTLRLGRYAVKSLAKQIASMHVRDRDRLNRELARIREEVEAISIPEVAS